jgi:hypothetical protein
MWLDKRIANSINRLYNPDKKSGAAWKARRVTECSNAAYKRQVPLLYRQQERV